MGLRLETICIQLDTKSGESRVISSNFTKNDVRSKAKYLNVQSGNAESSTSEVHGPGNFMGWVLTDLDIFCAGARSVLLKDLLFNADVVSPCSIGPLGLQLRI